MGHGIDGAAGAFHFVVAGMADDDDPAAQRGLLARLQVHLGHQRAGGVDDLQLPILRLPHHRVGHAVGREHRHRTGRHVVQAVNEHRAAAAQVGHHVAVVHDLVEHVHRGAMQLQGTFNDVHRPHHTGTEAAGLCQQHLHGGAPGP